MGNCNVCFCSGYDGDMNDFYHPARRKARKAHRCCECGRVIEPGQEYHNDSGKTEDSVWRYKTCLVCREISDKFSCDGFMFETLWENMREQVFPSLTTGCLTGLSVEARKFALEQWREWKGLTA